MCEMKRLLFVFAHPDDESFACGGSIAKYNQRGDTVYLVCATSGCKGRSGEFQFNCREELAKHREQELQRAAEILGVAHTHLYHYPDGSLADQDQEELAQRILATILEIKPNVVVTFPPDGVTGHPDHIAISQATERAVALSEQSLKPSELCDLYFASIPHYYDHCQDKGPKMVYPITGKIDVSRFREEKGRALQAHLSQEYSVNRAFPGVLQGDFGVIGSYEYYTLIRSGGQRMEPKPPAGEIPVIDFF